MINIYSCAVWIWRRRFNRTDRNPFPRKLRTRLVTYIGNQLDATIGREILEKVIFLPMSFLEKSSIGSQITRVKDYDSLRNVVTGGLINIIFDIPVAILFSLIVAFLTGILALVLIITATVFLIFILLF